MNDALIRCAAVTGPTGAVGTALCAYLIDRGIKVYAIVRPHSARIGNLPCGVVLVSCDIGRLSSLSEKIPDKVDAFFHLAWSNTIGAGRNDVYTQIDNVRYAVDAVHAAADLGCGVFVGAGSQAEYGRVEGKLTAQTPCFPENSYGMAKLCAGEMTRVECEKLGIRHEWVRILSVYGPHDSKLTMVSSVIDKLMRGERPALTQGIQMWDYLYARDAADALYKVAILGKNGRVYPLGSGTVRPLHQYIEIIRDEINPELPLGFGEIPYSERQVMYLQADISQLQADTGFAPTVDFVEGIRETIRCNRKELERENQ